MIRTPALTTFEVPSNVDVNGMLFFPTVTALEVPASVDVNCTNPVT